MILLSFSSALKYMISVLLAILGLIPHEAVVSHSGNETAALFSDRKDKQRPLQAMTALPFREGLYVGGEAGTEKMHPIPARNILFAGNSPADVPADIPLIDARVTGYRLWHAELSETPQRFIIVRPDDSPVETITEYVVIRSGN